MTETRIEERAHGTLHYLTTGQGPVLLAFHGAIGNAESLGWFLSVFGREFRVIAPSLGDLHDVDRFADDVASLLDAEGVERVALFGISFGGLLAQAFAARHPDRVDRLILMSCGVPRRTAMVLYALAGTLAQLLPRRAVRAIVGIVLTRRLTPRHDSHATIRRALRAHRRRLRDFASRVEKELVVARFRIVTEIHRSSPHICERLQSKSHPTLVLVADDDPLLSSRAQARLRIALPDAHVHTFRGGGHLIPLLKGEEMRTVITTFTRL